MFFKK